MDEAHVGWGYDDVDLYRRLRQGLSPAVDGSALYKLHPARRSERRKNLYQDIGHDKTGGDGVQVMPDAVE